MKKVFALVVCALIALGCSGCKKDQRPADLPEDMTPCKIILTQEGKPLADATVEFAYSTQVKYTTSGSTDEKGVATMVTYGYPGAQQGVAKIVVRKVVTEGASEAEEYGESGDSGSDFNVVGAKYRSAETTDLEITIGKENVEETFELGPAVKEPAN